MPTVRNKQKTALTYLLLALVPYSKENLALTFAPKRFFAELEKTSGYSRSTLKNAYWRANNKGLVKLSAQAPMLTAEGLNEIRPYQAKQLGNKAVLMVIFDIPESERLARQQLRSALKFWGFTQIQKSVWATNMDYRELLLQRVRELKLQDFVEVFESVRLFPLHK